MQFDYQIVKIIISVLFVILDIVFTYKYCQKKKSGVSLLEIGLNRELEMDFVTENPPNFVLLSDGGFRVNHKSTINCLFLTYPVY